MQSRTDAGVAGQFQDALQQRQAATLGVWIFLATEVLFFGAIFASFYVARYQYEKEFVAAARELKWWLGGINTAVLLISSFCMADAVYAARQNQAKRLSRALFVTAALGVIFLAIKATEYGIEYHDHLVPKLNFPSGQPHRQLFMLYYFTATGLHALHVSIGIVIVTITGFLSSRGRFGEGRHNFVDGVGLYWHFVDLVWVFLYPTLYLLRQG